MSGTIDPSTTALLLTAYQPLILGFLSDPGPLIDRAENAIEIARGRGGHVGFVRVAFTDEDCALSPSGVALATAREGHDLDYTVVVVKDVCADPDPDIRDFLEIKLP